MAIQVAFIKSHQGTNKSVCTLIKHEKRQNKSLRKSETLMVCHELEFAIKLILASH